MKISNQLVFNEVVSAPFVTKAIEVFFATAFTIQVIIDGNSQGTMIAEVSGDGKNWTFIPNSTQQLIGPTTHIYNANGAGYAYIRLVYTHDTGTANFKITINRKQ